jgi:hypothetical protein
MDFDNRRQLINRIGVYGGENGLARADWGPPVVFVLPSEFNRAVNTRHSPGLDESMQTIPFGWQA